MSSRQGSNSYYDTFVSQRKGKREISPDSKKKSVHRIIDPLDALKNLESQLERIADSVRIVKDYGKRMESLKEHNQSLEDKVLQLTVLVDESSNLNSKRYWNEIEDRVYEIVNKRIRLVDDKLTAIESSVQESIKKWSSSLDASSAALEKKWNKRLDKLTRKVEESYEQTELRLTTKFEALATQNIENMSQLNENIKCSVQTRLEEMIQQRCDEMNSSQALQLKSLKSQLADLRELLQEKMAHITRSTDRTLKEQNTIVAECVAEVSRIEAITNTVQSSTEELTREVRQRAWSAEQTCTRLAEDVVRRVDDYKSSINVGIENVESSVQREVKQCADVLKEFREEIRREFQRRETALASLMHEAEKQLKKLRKALPKLEMKRKHDEFDSRPITPPRCTPHVNDHFDAPPKKVIDCRPRSSILRQVDKRLDHLKSEVQAQIQDHSLNTETSPDCKSNTSCSGPLTKHAESNAVQNKKDSDPHFKHRSDLEMQAILQTIEDMEMGIERLQRISSPNRVPASSSPKKEHSRKSEDEKFINAPTRSTTSKAKINKSHSKSSSSKTKSVKCTKPRINAYSFGR